MAKHKRGKRAGLCLSSRSGPHLNQSLRGPPPRDRVTHISAAGHVCKARKIIKLTNALKNKLIIYTTRQSHIISLRLPLYSRLIVNVLLLDL